MKLKKLILLSIVSTIILITYQNKELAKMPKPPVAKKIAHITKVNNHTVEDNYFWLRDPNWPKVNDPEILQYLNNENEYADKAFFSQFTAEKEKLFEEMKGRIQLTDKSTEVKKDNYYYYERTLADQEYPIYCRRLGLSGNEEVILDVNKLAQGKKYTRVGSIATSPDQSLLAYSVDHNGDERFTIKIIKLADGKELADEIDSTVGAIVWHEKLNGFFYTPVDENWRALKVMFHKLGSSNSDNLVLEEKNPLYSLRTSKSSSKKFLLIETSGHQENKFHILNFATNSLTPQLFAPIREKIFYNIDHNDKFYIHTNDISSNFRLATTDETNTDSQYWQEYIKADEQEYLSSFDITDKYLVLNYKVNGLPIVRVSTLNDKEMKEVKFPDDAYTASGYSTNFEENDIRISYSSLARTDTVYQYDYTQGTLTTLKVREIPSGFNPDEYEVQREWSDNKGVKVPTTVFFKKSLMKQDGKNPLYLYGYGSYGISIPPSFRSTILSLVDRGFIFAIAHIRGGDDLGHKWYEDAKFLNKKRTFEDFIAVTEDLINKKYTSKGKIVISGGSAGGLLIGNVINSRPELYKAAVTHVPFVDVLNTMLDETLPLTPGEFKEWGNPKEQEYFEYIKSYSPYDNVRKQNYPHMFISTSISDPRVGYFEPAKWVAKLREYKTDHNILLLKTNMDAGHVGASGRFDYLKEVADDYVFILSVFGIKP